jgi:hypothetical protein
MRLGTVSLARDGKSEDVATVVCMPVVELTPFFAADTTRMRARIEGQ